MSSSTPTGNPDATASGEPLLPPLGGGAGNDLKPATLALLIMLIALGVAAAMVSWAPQSRPEAQKSAVNLAPPPWWPTSAEMAAITTAVSKRRSTAATIPKGDARTEALVKAYVEFNRADVAAAGSPKSKRLQDAHADYSIRAREYFRFEGGERFIALGGQLLDDFFRAMARKNRKAMVAVSGSFISEAQTIGLLRGAFEPAEHAKPIIASAFMLRWASVLTQERSLSGLITPEERLLLLRFKVGAHRALPPERRMALAKTVRRLQPDFPTDELLASRFAAERRWKLCARFYRRALKGRAEDVTLRANVRFCDEQAAGVQPQSP